LTKSLAPPACIGFIGLGLMGGPMAVNLSRAGFQVTGWNRTPDKTIALQGLGVRPADAPEVVAAGADAVILMLSDGVAVSEILVKSQLLPACSPNTLIIDMSSIAPSVAKDHSQVVTSNGLRYLDAPVSGGTIGAKAGSLSIMVGGRSEDFEYAKPLFEALGIPHLVGQAGSGQLCKLANLTLVAITIGAVAEALTLVRSGGGDPSHARDVLLGGFSQSRILEVHGQRMIDRDFKPGGRIKNQIKDLDTILETASSYGVAMPLTAKVRDLFGSLQASHGEDLDHSALILQIEAMAQGTGARS
jgi:2-hydroxy-3-oxopropionate reductase